ncbi:hypothetical protein A6F49_09105 [Enteractinococcus helveticum]|uniref:Uncharacterized protein n=1 Tax=Enteractinococcus helveticum TaxID=1837282 RepID=A0A1B7M0G8_9MICC|nr:hypothetical protein A6F49_09105 [Enteractinococcus helveticum]
MSAIILLTFCLKLLAFATIVKMTHSKGTWSPQRQTLLSAGNDPVTVVANNIAAIRHSFPPHKMVWTEDGFDHARQDNLLSQSPKPSAKESMNPQSTIVPGFSAYTRSNM